MTDKVGARDVPSPGSQGFASKPACPPCEDCGAEMVQTAHDTWECGESCPWSRGEMYEDGMRPGEGS